MADTSQKPSICLSRPVPRGDFRGGLWQGGGVLIVYLSLHASYLCLYYYTRGWVFDSPAACCSREGCRERDVFHCIHQYNMHNIQVHRSYRRCGEKLDRSSMGLISSFSFFDQCYGMYCQQKKERKKTKRGTSAALRDNLRELRKETPAPRHPPPPTPGTRWGREGGGCVWERRARCCNAKV